MVNPPDTPFDLLDAFSPSPSEYPDEFDQCISIEPSAPSIKEPSLVDARLAVTCSNSDDHSQSGGTSPSDAKAILSSLIWKNEHAINGTWAPFWTVRATQSEARAIVLSTVLRWFNPSMKNRERNLAITRAHAGGFCTSARDMARRTMMPPATAARAINWLCERELLMATPNAKWERSLLVPNPKGLALAFSNSVHDTKMAAYPRQEYLSKDSPNPAWIDSQTRHMAAERSPGVTIHNSILLVLGGDYLRARLMCQLLWFHDSGSGICRAKPNDNDRLAWWGMSAVRWAKMLGVSERSVRGVIKFLHDRELIFIKKIPYVTTDYGPSSPLNNTFFRRPTQVIDLDARNSVAPVQLSGGAFHALREDPKQAPQPQKQR